MTLAARTETRRPAGIRAAWLCAALFAAGLTPAIGPAHAQQNTPGAFEMSSDKPVRIEADMLEVLDDQNQAIFSGNVVAEQEDTTLRTSKLKVFYAGGSMMPKKDGDGAGEAANADAAPADTNRRITRLEADGQVVVTTSEQRATGDKAVFLMDENTVTLTGDVVLSQGENVLHGTELVVNLDTGRSKLVSNQKSGKPGRVSGMFVPGSGSDRPAGQ